jgi:hypothetical protein
LGKPVKEIPVASRVLEALRREKENQESDGSTANHVVLNTNGQPFADYRTYEHRFSRTLKRWNDKIRWTPKDLRKCLTTFGETLGVRNSMWRQYEGRSPEGVVEKHYIPRLATVSRGESEELDRRMKIFRTQVLTPVEQGIQAALSGKTLDVEFLNFFEREASEPLIC